MPEPESVDAAAARLFTGLLRRTHLSRPSDLTDVVIDEARAHLGADDVVVSLVNHEFTALVPIPSDLSPDRPPQPVDGSMAGRAFVTSGMVFADATPDPRTGGPRRRAWIPLLDGTDRIGVVEMTLPAPGGRVEEDLAAVCERYAHLVAQTVVTKGLYGDAFERVQRSRPMTAGSELMRSMLPPLLYATDGLVVTGMLEPAYDNGGDAFDYAVNRDRVHLAVLDGMGHGLSAATVTAVALAAYRNARIEALPLVETYRVVHEAVHGQFGGDRHVTAVLAELDLSTGQLSWLSAGHPPPLLLRGARVVKTLQATPFFPLGWDFGGAPTVAHEQLQTGDSLLLYTDGLIEARLAEGGLLGIDGLAGFLEQEAAAGQTAPETLRRMRRAVLEHQGGVLQDDATALLVEWRRGSEAQLMPWTVLED
ncbi:PP2C family protein-serine/threonine phosphatase [Kineococcus sp. SYSU DK002]|uniref:PP2C family protein-serine/threonine phosphatase n=1 Tax=Kineococcus sp. SYSU DK002 TaxID=3383123 RepID=UPI003D7CFF4C